MAGQTVSNKNSIKPCSVFLPGRASCYPSPQAHHAVWARKFPHHNNGNAMANGRRKTGGPMQIPLHNNGNTMAMRPKLWRMAIKTASPCDATFIAMRRKLQRMAMKVSTLLKKILTQSHENSRVGQRKWHLHLPMRQPSNSPKAIQGQTPWRHTSSSV